MKIQLDNKEAAEFLHSALCNGLHYLGQYGVVPDYTDAEYDRAKAWLKTGRRTWDGDSTGICYEDVLMAMVMTDGLRFVDEENNVDSAAIHITTLEERMAAVPAKWLLEMIEGRDDAETADVILQYLLYGELVFG